MVGGTALIYRLVVTRPAPIASSSSLSRADVTVRAYSSSFATPNSPGAQNLPVRWRSLGPGSLCGSGIQRHPSFFGGDFAAMDSNSPIPPVFGKSMRGVRMMGGGPRTFPGGVSKWQWKRMQDKKARQIEKARLLRERQSYEERRRQELMVESSGHMEKPWEPRTRRNPLAPASAALDPQVRALADRFRLNKGIDLWNDADGPEVAADEPSRISPRFLPNHSSTSTRAPMLDNSLARVFMSGRSSQMDGRQSSAARSEGRGDRTRRSAVANSDRSVDFPTDNSVASRGLGSVVSSTGSANTLSTPRGLSSGLLGKLDNLSIARSFSSSSSGAAVVDDYEERSGGRVRQEREYEERRGGRGRQERLDSGMHASQRGLTRSGSGKRFAESTQSAVIDRKPLEADQQRKKVRPTPANEDTPKTTSNGASSVSHLSESRFDQFAISPLSIKALHDVMGYERMTEVQAATFPVILEGKDVLAKAKTGTGKTIAFLLPSIEAILKARSERNSGAQGRTPVNVLIICPTRELASQAATEAKTLMTYHRGMGSQIAIGGTNVTTESNNFQRNPCQVLVATPGRLLDHMSNREFVHQLSQLKVLVLDEADRLLDMGFRRDLEKIIKMLPANRQTLLFSATVPSEVHKVSELALKRNHIFIDTVGKDTEDTHAKVQQEYIIAPLEKQMATVYRLLEEHMEEEEDYKVLVFCTTARCTGLMAEFSTKLGYNTLEIHSRKSQAYRTRVSDTFRKSLGVIMFTSDVSARGVDYPDVTLVIQVGIPAGREEYIHRLGRTGRAGKEGLGVLILAPWEQQFLRALKDIPIVEASIEVTPGHVATADAALNIVSTDTKEKAYVAWLGYYNSAKMLNLSKPELVELANFFSSTIGLDEPPALMKKTIGMMGLKGVPGLRSS